MQNHYDALNAPETGSIYLGRKLVSDSLNTKQTLGIEDQTTYCLETWFIRQALKITRHWNLWSRVLDTWNRLIATFRAV